MTNTCSTPLPNFILIGYRCTGKTSVAQKLSARLGIPLFDSDSAIEHQAGKSIADIFSQNGESAFRDYESEVIQNILAEPTPFVLSTGGGAILRESTRKLLRQSGRVIWLTANPTTILHRLTNDAQSETMRPRLTALPMLEEIVAILEQRKPLYEETAHETIAADALTIDEIVDKLCFFCDKTRNDMK